MTESDQKILDRGPYSRSRIVTSGLLGTFVGFGTGHSVQSRYKQRGWIFTAGEGGGLTIMGVGVVACASADDDNDDHDDELDLDLNIGSADCLVGVIASGLAVFSGFRLWEIVDIWAHPVSHNRRHRELKAKTDAPKWSLQITPRRDGGATMGLALRF